MGECDPIKIEEYNNFSDPQTKYLVYRVWMRNWWATGTKEPAFACLACCPSPRTESEGERTPVLLATSASITSLAPSEKSASNWSNWFVITKPSAEKKPGRGQDCVVAASLAGVVSRIGQGGNHGT